MSDLENLLESFESTGCECAYRQPVGSEKIVFVHDSYKKKRGQVYEFTDQEYGILTSLLRKTKLPSNSYQFVAAVKDFNVEEDDISTKVLSKHREFLSEDLDEIQPNLIIPLGNLALKAVTKKSGVATKRGKEFHIQLESETVVPVVPTIHPGVLYLEPKDRRLFIQDVNNAYAKFILKTNRFDSSPYELVNGDLPRALELLEETLTKEVVAMDLETEGLDFKKHKVLTIGFSFDEKQGFVIPIHHKESEFSPLELSKIKEKIQELMSKEDIVKVFHNCKFDLKFLMNWGLKNLNNIEDTQVMHSLIDENLPHGLMDLVKQFFPSELETY